MAQRGRPKDPNKLIPLPCRVTPAMEEHLAILAYEHRLPMSEVIRVLLEERLKEHPVTDIQRAALRRRRVEEMGIEPSRRSRLRSVRAHSAGLTSGPVQLDRFAASLSHAERPGRAARAEAQTRAA
jgi:hypothetical protein